MFEWGLALGLEKVQSRLLVRSQESCKRGFTGSSVGKQWQKGLVNL